MDADASLRNLENSLRDFIDFVLRKKFGANWIDSLSIQKDRVARWTERQVTEAKRLPGQALEDRLIYYADFYDLKSIITKHWEDGFSQAFPEKRWIEVLLSEMEKLRDPHAHNRELAEYQKHLILGVSGLVSTRIMKFRGAREDVDSYFPVIEAVSDSLGNKISNPIYGQAIVAKEPVRVGDTVEIRVFSTDPLGDPLEYIFGRKSNATAAVWQKDNWISITFEEADIGKSCDVNIMIRTTRPYHAYSGSDDYVWFRYHVLPAMVSKS